MTVKTHLSKTHVAFIFGVSLFLLLGMIALSCLPIIASQKMAFALSLDFIVTVPLVYFLLIRKTKNPKTTVITFLLAGVFFS